MQIISLAVILVYIVGTTVISALFAKRNKDSGKYLTADKSLGTMMIAALIFSEIVAGSGTVGNAQTAFNRGLSSVWAQWGMGIGCFLFLLLVRKFYRAFRERRGLMTIPNCFGYMFDQRSRVLMIFVVAVVYIIFYSSQPVAAAGILAPLLGTENTTLIAWIVTAIFVIVAMVGGMYGIAAVGILHSAIMFVGSAVIAILAVHRVGGWAELQSALPTTYFSLAQPSLATTLANALGTAISFLAAANITNASFSAKSSGAATKGTLLAGILVFPFALMPAITGICAKLVMPNITSSTALVSMAEYLGPAFSTIISLAVLAAIWSSGPALLLIVGGCVAKDLYVPFINPKATEKQQVWCSRTVVLIAAAVATLLGLNATSILNQLLGALQIRSVVGIVLVAAIVWKRVSANAAFWSMLGGGVVAMAWFFGGKPFDIEPLWPAAVVCLVILIPMTLMSKEKVSPGYLRYQEAVREMEEEAAAERAH
ncbi:sodium:solute symporter family transporter [Lawsonibacter celer]|uniref:sodium:solute symporter family transporter n=1 Tax=Lawsonibacter celer TaxID=2986526 RepID=UPI0016451F03